MKRALLSMAAAALFAAPIFTAGDVRADSNADIAEKMVRILERVATVVDMNKSDCNAMGDKLNAIIDENSAFLADAKARADGMTKEQRDAIQARYRARIQAATAKMMPGMRACATNAKVMSAIKRVQ